MSEYLDVMKEQYKALQQAVWNTEHEIAQLEIENKSLREALRQSRLLFNKQGYTMRYFAKCIGITAAQLSVWTDSTPDQKPDFKD